MSADNPDQCHRVSMVTGIVVLVWYLRSVNKLVKQSAIRTLPYVSLRLRVQNAVPAQPCVGKLGISLVLLNFLDCNFRLWFETP